MYSFRSFLEAQGTKIKPSKIHGHGTFAAKSYKKGDKIGLACTISGKDKSGRSQLRRTEMCKFINYANKPDDVNVELKKVGNKFNLHAVRDIASGAELVLSGKYRKEYAVLDYPGKSVFVF